jgi:hypothetical protein
MASALIEEEGELRECSPASAVAAASTARARRCEALCTELVRTVPLRDARTFQSVQALMRIPP